MKELFDETICDRVVTQPPGVGKKNERAIMLVIIAGGDADFGKHFVLEKDEVTIGRGAGNDILIHDGKISKAHCSLSIVRGRGGVERIGIRDLGTTNGTHLNGEPVLQGTLKAGDKIQIGETVLQLSYGDEIEREYHARLFELAARDALTGLYNKRFVLNELENHLRISRRSGRVFSIILLDIDDFKQVNDRFGHLVGDDYLRQVAGLFARCLREQDIAGRIGGEELLVILPETALDGAFHLATRVRESVEAFVLPLGEEPVRTTISAGVCQYENGLKDAREFLTLADQALYEAKKAEKNKVMRAGLKGAGAGTENKGQ